MITQQELDELKAAEGKATHTCVTCGSSVGIYSADEGTASYEPLPTQKLRELIEEVERLRSGYLTDEHGNEYVQVCFLKEKIREQAAENEKLRTALEKARESLSVAGNQLEGVAIGIGKHRQEINPEFWIVTYVDAAKNAREALRSIEGVLGK